MPELDRHYGYGVSGLQLQVEHAGTHFLVEKRSPLTSGHDWGDARAATAAAHGSWVTKKSMAMAICIDQPTWDSFLPGHSTLLQMRSLGKHQFPTFVSRTTSKLCHLQAQCEKIVSLEAQHLPCGGYKHHMTDAQETKCDAETIRVPSYLTASYVPCHG